MRRAGILAVILLSAGCAQSDPVNSRLAAGSRAIAAGKDKVYAYPPAKGSKPPDLEDAIGIPVGTEIQVESDDDRERLMTDIPLGKDGRPVQGKSDLRKVRVTVIDGEFRGRIVDIKRYELRPLAE